MSPSDQCQHVLLYQYDRSSGFYQYCRDCLFVFNKKDMEQLVKIDCYEVREDKETRNIADEYQQAVTSAWHERMAQIDAEIMGALTATTGLDQTKNSTVGQNSNNFSPKLPIYFMIRWNDLPDFHALYGNIKKEYNVHEDTARQNDFYTLKGHMRMLDRDYPCWTTVLSKTPQPQASTGTKSPAPKTNCTHEWDHITDFCVKCGIGAFTPAPRIFGHFIDEDGGNDNLAPLGISAGKSQQATTDKKCTCGMDSIGGGYHSTWCDKK